MYATNYFLPTFSKNRVANKRPQELSDKKGGNLLASRSDRWIKFLIRTNLIEFFLRRPKAEKFIKIKKNLRPTAVESTVVNRIVYLTNNTILNLIFLQK